jgi:hypothetical protein
MGVPERLRDFGIRKIFSKSAGAKLPPGEIDGIRTRSNSGTERFR